MVNFKKHIGLNSGFNSTFARRVSGVAPVNTVAPEITGTLEVGETLTCSTGTWTGTEPITYSYQWKRGVTNIGTNSNTYEAVYDDIDEDITCVVTANNDYGSDIQVSNTVSLVITLQAIVDYYGFLNFWSAENLTIVGTTTTALDYKSEHDLSNPGATNQPTFNASDVEIGNKPSLNFATDDFLQKLTSYRNSDSSGVITFIIKVTSGVSNGGFTSSLITSNIIFIDAFQQATKYRTRVSPSSSTNICESIADQSNNTYQVVSMYSKGNGVGYGFMINGVEIPFTMFTGTDSGQWFEQTPTRDGIFIGSTQRSINKIYLNGKWFCSGYMPYSDIPTIQNLHNDLRNYLGI